MSSVALDLQSIRKVYGEGETAVNALDGVSLQLAAGEIVCMLGPSGSGKTTLVSIAGGLLTPTSGKVVVDGKDITGLDPRELARFRSESVGFVFQAVNLVPFLTAQENLVVVDDFGPRTGKAAVQRARQLLGELGLGDRLDNLPSQLSGGQRQRVAIGRALMNEPSLVMFDEPTSALDTELGEQVMDLIRSEMHERNKAAIIVTHDERITHYADRIVNIVDGKLAE